MLIKTKVNGDTSSNIILKESIIVPSKEWLGEIITAPAVEAVGEVAGAAQAAAKPTPTTAISQLIRRSDYART